MQKSYFFIKPNYCFKVYFPYIYNKYCVLLFAIYSLYLIYYKKQ